MIPLEEYLPTPEREEPAARDPRGIDGRDIRFLTCYDGGFFEGDSNIEVWYAPNIGCYRVRFWHDHGHPISRHKARVINPPDSVSIEEMNSLITRLLDLGLADTYSFYRNKDVLDGGSWHLTIGTRDGYCWSWGGYSAYPKGWDAARDAICELFLGFPSRVPYDGHTSYIADWHGPDGDRGRTDVAHLYRHGVALGDAQKWRILYDYETPRPHKTVRLLALVGVREQECAGQRPYPPYLTTENSGSVPRTCGSTAAHGPHWMVLYHDVANAQAAEGYQLA